MAGMVESALLSAFLQVAFDRLASRDVLDFFRRKRLDETLINKSKIMLLSLNTVVDDAEQKQITNPNVKDWLDMVKDAVYDAEDVFDDIDYEATKRKVEAELSISATAKVRKFLHASVSSFEKEVEARMKKVLESLEYLSSQKDILNLKEGACRSRFQNIVPARLPTTSLVDEDEVYGRNDDKEMIINWLLSENNNNQLSVMSVVGMGGLGKTTLAQLVYNDQRLEDAFDLKAWTCVSDEFDVTRLTRAIVEAISWSTNDNIHDLNLLQIKLKQLLSQKRFLLVLDDVWNENYMLWEALQTPFKYGALGSKILVTTRSGTVASIMRSTKIHDLQQLSEDQSWCLFRRYAFSADTSHSNSDFEDVGREIMKKCKGLPLALKTIASLLYTKSSKEEWKVILKSGVWEEERNVLPALRLSYHYLPSLLKRCFVYCSLFPKDCEFDKEHLIQLWMAENFLQCAQQNKDLRDVGEQFFHDLLSRSFFQQSTRNKMHFVMHDLVNDMAKYEAGKFFHRLEIDEANNLVEMTRHVSYLRKKHETSKRFETISRATRLHTFLPLSMGVLRLKRDSWVVRFISSTMIHNLLSKFLCLRALSLSDYRDIVELPDSVGNLKHLRYLDLSGARLIKKLPDSICELYHLQTLKLWCCVSLESLPMELHKLTNLRHIDFRETKVTEMPKHLEKLKNLQILSSFIVGKCRDTDIKQLKELNLRGTLSIGELQNVINPSDALALNLKSKICIEELKLKWSMNRDTTQNDKDVLEKLQPHNNLKKLSISCYGGIEFPYWFADNTLSNIVSLELSICMSCLSLPSLGLLLPSLEILSFLGMEAWEKWEHENVSGVFSRLREFSIVKCPRLKENLPGELPSLRKLVIEHCEQLVASLPKAPCLNELVLRDCGKLQLECLPSTLKVLVIGGILPEIFSAEKIDSAISNTCLQELRIFYCARLELQLRHHHNSLVKMKILCCDSLKDFPLDLFPMLQDLDLSDCINLETISDSGENSHSLTGLLIENCPKFVSFPNGGFLAPKLVHMVIIDLESLKSLPDRMHFNFPSFRSLQIGRCPQVESFPEGGLSSTFKRIIIDECPKLMAARMEWNLHSLSSLDSLEIRYSDVESFPNEGLLPSSLVSLSIKNCSNLRTLDHRGICHLPALKELTLSGCPKLHKFPKEGLPNTLSTLSIEDCPLLKKRCQKPKGKDWDKISHIPCIVIDHDVVT